MSIPGSFDGSSETKKRKRAVNYFESSTIFDSTIENPKRPKHNEVPSLPSAQTDAPLWSAATTVYIPSHELQALNGSRSFGALPSNRKTNGYYKKSQLDLRHMCHESPAHLTSDEALDSCARKNTRQSQTDSMTIVERKHFFLYNPAEGIQAAAKKYFSEVYQLLDMSGSNDDCRLHPTPPQSSGKPAGKISFCFNWRDEHGSHRLTVNWGIIALLVRQQLTDAQMDGFANKSWHLSHLCGNWTCCNWRHFIVESGSTNSSRNGCFNSPAKCTHNPLCMKEKKRQLLVTDHIRNEISKAITSLGGLLSYESFHALAESDMRLVEWFWENSRRGSCAFCGRSDNKAHICSCLSSLVYCKVMLRALKQCIKPTLEVREAIGYMIKIKEDLERGSAFMDKTLTELLVRPGGSDISLDVQPIAEGTSQQVHRCTELALRYLRHKNTEEELVKKLVELHSKCRQPESTAEYVDLSSEVRKSHRKTVRAMINAKREWRESRRVQGKI